MLILLKKNDKITNFHLSNYCKQEGRKAREQAAKGSHDSWEMSSRSRSEEGKVDFG